MRTRPGWLAPQSPDREKCPADDTIAIATLLERAARALQSQSSVRRLIQIVVSVLRALEALANTPSALHVAIPVHSSAERAPRRTPRRGLRRFP